MNVILEFTDEQKSEAKIAINAASLYSNITQALDTIRSQTKYGKPTVKELTACLERVRADLTDGVSDLLFNDH